MIKEIKMPAGGQTTDTSTVGAWLVKKGDKVKRGDELLSVETDKATLTVESFAKGTVLAILADDGTLLAAGEVMALIGDENDILEVEASLGSGQAEAKKPGPPSKQPEEEYQPIDKQASIRYASARVQEKTCPLPAKVRPDDIKAMPGAKLLAKENSIALKDVAAYTGKEILKRADVQKYLDGAMHTAGESEMVSTSVPLTSMRRTIARRMLLSAQTIPVFRATTEVNMKQCIAFRARANQAGKEHEIFDRRISYNDILFKCMEVAVRKYPYVNATYTDSAILLHPQVNIGLAVSVDAGLVVPVVKNVQEKTILEIAEANKRNVVSAREGKLAPEDMSGGTITLSNLGMEPVLQFDAIINPPEVCILAMGMIVEKLMLENGQLKTVPVMHITGSFDHRVVDGAYGAKFLAELKRLLEAPAMMLL